MFGRKKKQVPSKEKENLSLQDSKSECIVTGDIEEGQVTTQYLRASKQVC